jgi:hypothetical protein
MNIAKAMMHLEDLGVKKVIVKYSGGGDSGQIDEILFSKTEDDDENDGEDIGVNKEVLEIIEAKAYRLLNPIEDWYNNDGGYGTVIIQVPTGEYNIENNIYITETETYEHDGKLEDLTEE